MSVVEQPTLELNVHAVKSYYYYIVDYSQIIYPTPHLQKAEKAKRLAKEEAEKKLLEMAERTKSELQELLLASK